MAWFEGFEGGLHAAGEVELFARTGGDRGQAAAAAAARLSADARHVASRRAQLARRLLARHPRPARLRRLDQARPAAPPGRPCAAQQAGDGRRHGGADERLGHERFSVAGHDRGGRVAHRLALDHAGARRAAGVIDIAPTLDMYDATDMRFATRYYHWFFLIQPAPLPERMIGGDPAFYLRATLGGWGCERPRPHRARGAGRVRALLLPRRRDPRRLRGLPRRGDIDLEHDRAARAPARRSAATCSCSGAQRGLVGKMFDPLALWRRNAPARSTGRPLPAGPLHPRGAARRDTATRSAFVPRR